MDNSEIRSEIAKLNKKVEQAEHLLKGLSEESKIDHALDIIKIKAKIEDTKNLAQLYKELLHTTK